MGAIKNQLKNELKNIFENLSPNATAEQKADQIATAIENAILQGLQVKILPGQVLIGATGGIPNPTPISCQLES